MSAGNGRIRDEGLIAINESFRGAKFLEQDAKLCADLMCIGSHRDLQISDATAMEMFATITEGKCFVITRLNTQGQGYQANIETYGDLANLFERSLLAYKVDNDETI
jgi:hypothetical protein